MIPVKIEQKVHIKYNKCLVDHYFASEHMHNMMPFTHWKTAQNGQMSKLNEKVQASSRSPLPAVIQPTTALSANNPKQDCQKWREVKMESGCSSFKILTAY